MAAAALVAAMVGVRVSAEAPAERRYSPLAPPEPRPVARPRAERNKPRRRSHGTSYWTPNGSQECARRRRQIAAGILTVANGLVILPERSRNVRDAVYGSIF